MPETLSGGALAERIDALPAGDQALLRALVAGSLAALAVGLVLALGLVAELAGVAAFATVGRYQVLTLHATTLFYYWLYFVQAAVVLAVLRIYSPSVPRLCWRRLGWVGAGLMGVGGLLNSGAAAAGAAITYVAPAALAVQFPHAATFYAGYLALSTGLLLLAAVAIRTAVATKSPGEDSWPSLLFACVLWWGLAAVSALASVNAYLPPFLRSLGMPVATPASYLMNWSVLFHNMHYLPLVSAVIVWYVVVEDATGASVKHVYSGAFTKYVFAFYLLLVPPTSLYHMFLSPSVPPVVKAIGSVLSLFMSIPTILHFMLIAAAVEIAARSNGSRGTLRWLRDLPWDNPGLACVGWAVACSVGGGLLANVLVQHGFATLLSDTFFVPAYFHFFTAGTVTLTFLGALAYVLPALYDRPLARPRLLARLAPFTTLGVYAFGTAGAVAGYLGMPRRTLEPPAVASLPALWEPVLVAVAAGGLVMAVGLLGMTLLLVVTIVDGAGTGLRVEEFPRVRWEAIDRSRPVRSGLVTMATLLGGWTALTVLTALLS